MSEINDGGPAFPQAEVDQSWPQAPGMSLRDWFAGQALAGLCANPDWINSSRNDRIAFALGDADAMIRARGDGND
jgi:hypothetical protein